MSSAGQKQQREDQVDAEEKQHAHFMRLALTEADKSEPTSSAFCVGCVIVCDGEILSTGYSRELAGNTHAEQCAIEKLIKATTASKLEGADLYTTMEPCSVRLSGNVACTDRILEVGCARVFLGTLEPADFVNCEGVQKLRDNGVEVHTVPGFADECLRIAKKGH